MEYVIIDIETTGLDIENSSIIEVGALLVSGSVVLKEYSSFVRFEGELPETTKRLTGIGDEMLTGAPAIGDVIKELRSFVGSRPVVAHNGFCFDYPILEREGMKFSEKYDSMEFAFFVLPTNFVGHSMDVLVKQFGLGTVPHRALEDCKLELRVIELLRAEWERKPKKQCTALKAIAKKVGWWWVNFLSGDSVEVFDLTTLVPPHIPYRKKDAGQGQLGWQAQPISQNDVLKQFDPVGQYGEVRPEQKDVAAFVAESFNLSTHGVVEAGTGVGKSKAYLVPSVLFAVKNNLPVVVSTYTKALQDQLFTKEIPHIRTTLRPDLRVALVKGKTNYVCLGKFRDFAKEVLGELRQQSLYRHGKEEKVTSPLAVLLLSSWILETQRGDWDELPFWLNMRISKDVMQSVCNVDELCAPFSCSMHDEKKCFLAKARERARDADIVILNHSVFLLGIHEVPGGYEHSLLPPEAKYVVIDESHHLEDAATSAWTSTLSRATLERFLNTVFDKNRGARNLMEQIAKQQTDDRLKTLLARADELEKSIRSDVNALFGNLLTRMLPISQWSESLSFEQLKETPSHEKLILSVIQNIHDRVLGLQVILEDFSSRTRIENDKRRLSIRASIAQRIVYDAQTLCNTDLEYVRFIRREGDLIEISAAPLSIAQDMKNLVFDNFRSVVMASATLTVGDSFDFFFQRCGVSLVPKEKVKHISRPSSFDFSTQSRFFVPFGISYGGKEMRAHHADACLEFLKQALVISQGGALVLCSSHEQVDFLYAGLYKTLSKNNIMLLRQSKKQSIASVVRMFAEDMNSVLIGTASLWQGVDVPGPSLRSLFIYKIPFPMPFEPIIKARKEEIKRNTGCSDRDAHYAYEVPLAALSLKQGFGRLIRKKTDTGIAVLMDDRILNKEVLRKSFPLGVTVIGATTHQVFEALAAQTKSVIVDMEVDTVTR